jgi:hypothetical protein
MNLRSGTSRKKRRGDINTLVLENCRLAARLWVVSLAQRSALKALTREFRLSVALGDVRLLDGNWYVTCGGLARLADRSRCAGIEVCAVPELCDSSRDRWVFKATVYKTLRSRGFVGYGDANPSNISPLVRGAEMRVAETRAVSRALRKAYAVALCSVEELGTFSESSQSFAAPPHANGHHSSNGSNNSQPRLRDQLCLLIRQHNLDPTLVKAYAADFCGTSTLREASRDLVESFLSELRTAAKSDRDSLLCKLNSYAQPTEVNA